LFALAFAALFVVVQQVIGSFSNRNYSVPSVLAQLRRRDSLTLRLI
jgi:hypothetical protein